MKRLSFEFQITLSYFLFGVIWILFSDKIPELFVSDPTYFTNYQTYKGVFFIFVTSLYLYFFIKNHMLSLRQAKSKLVESETHYKTLFNDNHTIIILVNPITAKIEDANPAACAYYGFTHDEMCSKKVYDFNVAGNEQTNVQPQALAAEKKKHLFTKARRADGDIRDVEIFSNPIRIGDKTLIYAIVNDITEQQQATALISKSEERYRKTLDQMLEGCQIIDFDWKLVYLNRTAEIQNRRPNSELIGKNYIEIWPGIENTLVFKKIEEVLHGNRMPVYFENEFYYPDGTKGWFDLSIQPVEEGVFILSIDITERKQKEEQFLESEIRFKKLYENGPFGMALVDENFKFIKANPIYSAMLGYTESELQQMTFQQITHPDDIYKDMSNVLKLIKNEIAIFRTEKRYIRKDGELIWVSLTITANYDNEGRFLYNLAIAEDITKSKLIEEELRRSKNLLAETESISKVGGWEIDTNTLRITWTDEVYRIYEVDTNFKHDLDIGISFYTPESQLIISQAIKRAIQFAEPFDLELEIITAKGNLRSVHTIGRIDVENNRVYGFFQDITKRKEIENNFLASQLNFFRTISDSPIGIRIVTVEGDTVYANKAFLDIYEFESLEEFTATPAIQRYTHESYIQHCNRREIRRNGGELFDYEISIVCKNKEMRLIKVSRKEILWNGTKHFQVINIDVTKQRNAETELRKLSQAVEQSPVAICITDLDGDIEYVNPKIIQLTGFSKEELIRENTRIFGSGEKSQEEYTELWQTIKSGKIWSGEFHNKNKKGELYWEYATIAPVFDPSGQITNFLAIKEDITNRKRSELALSKSEELLRKFASHLQSVREEEKIALAREIHDDLGQNLVALKIEAGLLKNKTVKINNTEHSEEIAEKFDRIIGLIGETIKTARRIMNGLRPELLELKGFVGAVTAYIQEFEERYQIVCEFKTDQPDLELDHQQSLTLFRILQESLSNIARHSKAENATVLLYGESDQLVMEIIDDGIGFDINNSGRQDSYGMIGMKERVVLLGGKINVKSEIGKGTTIAVSMPWK